MRFLHDKTVGSTEWLRRKVDYLLTQKEVLERLKAIRAVPDERRYAFDLSRELTTWACRTVSPRQGRPAFLNEYWARGTGKTWKALGEFPNRLEKIADELKRINKADPHFCARRRGDDLSRSALLRLQADCMRLPTMVQDYAKALRGRNWVVAVATPRSGSADALFQLTTTVKFATGKYHDQEVSELLNAVGQALGYKQSFGAVNIAQARSRRRKSAPQT
jgi:hypothetical protein